MPWEASAAPSHPRPPILSVPHSLPAGKIGEIVIVPGAGGAGKPVCCHEAAASGHEICRLVPTHRQSDNLPGFELQTFPAISVGTSGIGQDDRLVFEAMCSFPIRLESWLPCGRAVHQPAHRRFHVARDRRRVCLHRCDKLRVRCFTGECARSDLAWRGPSSLVRRRGMLPHLPPVLHPSTE